jgi:hypothetical protein
MVLYEPCFIYVVFTDNRNFKSLAKEYFFLLKSVWVKE